MPPETRYAKSGDVNIAYQVVGEDPLDLVLVHGWVQSFDAGWRSSRSGASTSGSRRSHV
jgi:pimeloyl-ACP methyl ester carboxylesterase